MGTTRTQGFTILETMLFLAVTGALVVALLAGVGTSINVQRYRDSLQSLKSLLQDQYTDLTNVYNDRDGSWSCTTGAQTTNTSGTTEAKGQSDCVVLGRYITIVDSDVTLSTVVGYSPTSTFTSSGSDIQTIKSNYTLGLSSITTENSQLEWGTRIAWPVSGNGQKPAGTSRPIAILLIRSPVSGTTYTFTSDTVPSLASTKSNTLLGMMVEGNVVPGQGSQLICLDSKGLVGDANQSIYLNAFTTNASGVETRSNEMNVGSQC